MLVPVIGGVVVGLLVAGSVWLHWAALGVPPRGLRRRWRSGG